MKNVMWISILVIVSVCALSVHAAPITQIERDRIDSLLQKADIPDDLRKDISQQLASEPELAVSDGDMATLWYVTKDTVRFGIISMPAGQGMKKWALDKKIDGVFWFNKYQIISIDEGRAIGLRIIRDYDGSLIFVIVLMLIFATTISVAALRLIE